MVRGSLKLNVFFGIGSLHIFKKIYPKINFSWIPCHIYTIHKMLPWQKLHILLRTAVVV